MSDIQPESSVSPQDLPIRVFVGSHRRFNAVEQPMYRCMVENASQPIEVRFMRPSECGAEDSGCTGFTNMRYCVPELAGYQGYAIYLDVDMFVLGDIAELFSYREKGKWAVMQDGSNEVAVIDCTQRNLPAARNIHKHNKHELKGMCSEVRKIPLEWNCEDSVNEGTKLLHFTDLKAQPWFYDHPNQEAVNVWERYAG